MEKKTIITITCVGVIAGIAVYGIYKHFKKTEEKSQWDIYNEMKYGYDTGGVLNDKRGGFEQPRTGDVPVVNEEFEELDEVPRVPVNYKVISDNKPDIDEILKTIEEKRREIDEKHEEASEEDDGTDIKEVVKEMDEIDSTYNVDDVEFDENGLPVFGEEDWEVEESDNISLISQSEYLENFQDHEKEQAVWFTQSNVLVNTELTPIDIVDTVGPTAFTTLCKNPDITVFVKNEELKTDYELFINDACTIETAWKEQGV